jgi:hypothetical protein
MASDGFFLFGKFQGVAPLLVTGQNYISRDKLPAPFGGPPGSTLTPTHHIGGAFFQKMAPTMAAVLLTQHKS